MDAICADLNHCPTCAYDLSAQPVEGTEGTRRCPECGSCWTDSALREIAVQRERRGPKWGLVLAAPGILGSLTLIAWVVVTRSEWGALMLGIGVVFVAGSIIAWCTQGPAGTSAHSLAFRAVALSLINLVIGVVSFVVIVFLLAVLRAAA